MPMRHLSKVEGSGSLSPAELQVAINAYEAAVKIVANADQELVRDDLAWHIIQSVFRGERDVAKIRDEAVHGTFLSTAPRLRS